MLTGTITEIHKAGRTAHATDFDMLHRTSNGAIVFSKSGYYIVIHPEYRKGEFFYVNGNIKMDLDLPSIQKYAIDEIWGKIEWISTD